ncbi:hypothetical protein [Photobacterium kishitanii]|uniref:hypothetical protein n=1 Tax=Photobacterium kishitanii TaxID=318456 RepID=UPI002739BAC5|nr:hypothetical protein [Photobacterium kishitanii]
MTYTKTGSDYQYIGFECRVTDGKPDDIIIAFDGDDVVATPSSKVLLKMRVDKGKVYELNGYTYNNSYRGGTARDLPPSLLDEIKTGNKLHLRIIRGRETEVMETFSLSGSTAALNKMERNSGVTAGEPSEMVAKKKEINTKYDNLISELEKKRQAEIQAVK